jgi:putative peptidoglycan lipid II flippase
MTLVSLTAAWRAGLRLWPRWDPRQPGLRALARAGAWAGAYLGLTQLLLAATLVMANRVEGGVVAYQIAFTCFLLPHAVLAHPVLTALYPRLASEAHAGRRRELAIALARGARLLVLLVVPASALMVALAHPALRLLQLGNLDTAATALVARVLAAYALGLGGYAGLHLLTRASYAMGDARTPALVQAGVTAAGAALMLVWSSAASGGQRVVVLGLAHSLVTTAGAAGLWVLVRRRLGEPLPAGRALARSLACAAAGGVVARLVADRLPAGGRPGAALVVAVGATLAVAAYVAGEWALGEPELRRGRAVQ